MVSDIRVAVEEQIIRVVYRGKAEFDVVTDMLRKVAQVASANKLSLVLFDAREADYKHYRTEPIVHAEENSVRIYQTFRVALLGSKDHEMLRYFENVGVNRGYEIKAFTDEPGAVAWLRSTL